MMIIDRQRDPWMSQRLPPVDPYPDPRPRTREPLPGGAQMPAGGSSCGWQHGTSRHHGYRAPGPGPWLATRVAARHSTTCLTSSLAVTFLPCLATDEFRGSRARGGHAPSDGWRSAVTAVWFDSCQVDVPGVLTRGERRENFETGFCFLLGGEEPRLCPPVRGLEPFTGPWASTLFACLEVDLLLVITAPTPP